MPRFLVPKRSTEHRVAAIALFRALLSQCGRAPISRERRDALHNAIGHQFWAYRGTQSHNQLSTLFRAGYELLDRLDQSVSGQSQSTTFIESLVDGLPRGIAHPKPKKIHPPPKPEPKPKPEPSPINNVALAMRPYPEVKGVRRVPVIASANGMPFLRIKKPQPASLAIALHRKLEARTENFETSILLNNYWLPIARQEDEWDKIIGQQHNIRDTNRNRWADTIRHAYEVNHAAFAEMKERNRAIAARLQDIVDDEQRLADEERVVRGRNSGNIGR